MWPSAVYSERFFVAAGGLISYGPDFVDQYRRAAGYVDRILRGEKPADLPVQAPNKYDLVMNVKTAKALGVTVPPTLLATAEENALAQAIAESRAGRFTGPGHAPTWHGDEQYTCQAYGRD